MSTFLERFFKLKENNTSIGVELKAGMATFLTMAYIIIVNPAILSQAGMSFNGVLFATCMVAALSTIFMGIYANLPFALAPGMGLNAFVAFSLIMGHGVSWQTAMGAVFVSGIIFIILSVTKIRELIVKSIPKDIRLGVASGIGLFLAFIGLKNAGIIVSNPATFVSFSGLNLNFVFFIFGLILIGMLLIKKIKGALLISIASISILVLVFSYIGVSLGFLESPLVVFPKKLYSFPSCEVFLKLDILGVLKVSMLAPLFTLLFTDMFDSISTFVGVSEVGNLKDEKGNPKNVGKALLVDAISTTISGLFGTSSGTTYIESAAGVEEGGRTGLTAVITGLLFIPFIFLSPLIAFIPAVATAPVLVIVGLFMMSSLSQINWKDYENSIPVFISMIAIPLTYSITQGIVLGFIIHVMIKILLGKAREVPLMLWIISFFSILSLILT